MRPLLTSKSSLVHSTTTYRSIINGIALIRFAGKMAILARLNYTVTHLANCKRSEIGYSFLKHVGRRKLLCHSELDAEIK